MIPEHPADPGLQPERTALAWRRTAFSIAIGSLVALRVLADSMGAWAVAPAAAGLVVSGLILVSSHRRYQHYHRALQASSEPEPLPHGGLIAQTAAVTLLFGAAGLVVVGVGFR